MITLHLTPAEYQHILTLLGRGTTSLIRPGEGLTGEQAIALADRVAAASDSECA